MKYCHTCLSSQQRKQDHREISGIEQYDIVCNDGIRIPKLGIKLAHLSNDAMVFEQQEAASCSPIERPEKDTGCQMPRLFSFHQSARALQVSILEGLVCTGRLIWFNQWELGFDNAHEEFFSVQACGHTSEIGDFQQWDF